ncbi:hypothetical protein J6590_079850, partial [Homalodisca vitripennis]
MEWKMSLCGLMSARKFPPVATQLPHSNTSLKPETDRVCDFTVAAAEFITQHFSTPSQFTVWPPSSTNLHRSVLYSNASDTTSYEFHTYHIKIPFNTQQNLPKNEPSPNSALKNLNNSQTYSKIQDNLSTIQTLIHQQMVAEHLPFIQRQQSDRNRRSLTFVGDFFKCCCDIAIEHQMHDLVDNEEGVYTAFSTQQHYLLSELPAHSPAS